MPAAVAVPLIMGGISAGATIYAANKQSNAVNQATQTQTAAGQHAIDVQAGLSREGLDFAKQQWAAQQQNMAPWLQYGGGALKTLGGLMGISPDMSLGGAGGVGGPGGTGGPSGPPAEGTPILTPTQRGPNSPPTAPGAGDPVATGSHAIPRPNANTLGQIMGPGVPTQGQLPPPGQVDFTRGPSVAPPPTAPVSRPQAATKRGDVARIRWTDGTEQVVAATDLYKYVQLGAEEVQT